MFKKPTILVTPLYDEATHQLTMQKEYINIIKSCGGVPVILPFESSNDDIEYLLNLSHGVVFTGGQDVNPTLYNEKVEDACGKVSLVRDDLENRLFRLAFKKDKAILGICRGCQIINVCLGGTLYQDIRTNGYNTISHSDGSYPEFMAKHQVVVVGNEGFLGFEKGDTFIVNSYHHQAVHVLADKLKPVVLSEDGLVEAFVHPDKNFLLGIQWHPERAIVGDDTGSFIFNEFILACQR